MSIHTCPSFFQSAGPQKQSNALHTLQSCGWTYQLAFAFIFITNT
jgi:hypothetical protein